MDAGCGVDALASRAMNVESLNESLCLQLAMDPQAFTRVSNGGSVSGIDGSNMLRPTLMHAADPPQTTTLALLVVGFGIMLAAGNTSNAVLILADTRLQTSNGPGGLTLLAYNPHLVDESFSL